MQELLSAIIQAAIFAVPVLFGANMIAGIHDSGLPDVGIPDEAISAPVPVPQSAIPIAVVSDGEALGEIPDHEKEARAIAADMAKAATPAKRRVAPRAKSKLGLA